MIPNMERPVALICGITGQDGSYLAEQLLDRGYEVHGLLRRSSTFNTARLEKVYKSTENPQLISLHYIDATEPIELYRVLEEISPSEIYNLTALSHVAQSYDQPSYAVNVNTLGFLHILEASRRIGLNAKIYQASTSEMFGSTPPPQRESSPMVPLSPYAAAKKCSHDLARIYREAFGMFVSTGILFNHESPRRSRTFVTRKISSSVAEITRGERQRLVLGNLDAKRDWGYAPEYTNAMWKILQLDEPVDLVIATGVQYSVRDFCDFAFSEVGLNWRDFVEVSEQFKRPLEVESLCGDITLSKELIDWKPEIQGKELASILVRADLERKVYMY